MQPCKWIDALKGIAMCGVVMIHSGGAGLPSVLGKVGASGANGVQLFFVISAFLAYQSYAKGEKSAVSWIVGRVTRIIPLYYIAVILYGLAGGSEFWLGQEGSISILNWISHFLLLHGMVPHYCNSIIGVEWYIGTLVLFYLVLPVLVKVINSFEKSLFWFVGGSLGSKVICWICWHLVSEGPDTHIYRTYFDNYWFFAQLPALLGGILLFFIYEKIRQQQYKDKQMAFFVLLLSGVFLAGNIMGSNEILGFSPITLWTAGFILLAVGLCIQEFKLIANPLFCLIGRYSYAIYLFHYFLIHQYEKYIEKITGNFILDWGIRYFIVMFLSLVTGIILNKIIEKPLYKLLNNKKE